MLTLAANRLSMIALKEKNERENGENGWMYWWNEMKGAKSEKRKKIKHKPTAVYLLKLGPSLSRLTKGERPLMGIQEKKKKTVN